MFPSKREISRSNGKTGDNLSKRESPVQNGRFGMYENHRSATLFLNASKKIFQLICKLNENQRTILKHSFRQYHQSYHCINVLFVNINILLNCYSYFNLIFLSFYLYHLGNLKGNKKLSKLFQAIPPFEIWRYSKLVYQILYFPLSDIIVFIYVVFYKRLYLFFTDAKCSTFIHTHIK